MKIILLTGGSGDRVWPLTGKKRHHQYAEVLKSKEGKPESLLQRLWSGLAGADLLEHSSFVACSEHAAMIRQQLGLETPIIHSPRQKNTFASAALAAASYYSASLPLSETIIILPMDLYVGGDFFHCIRSLPKLLRDSGAAMMMVGTKASFACEQYSYIIPEEGYYTGTETHYDYEVASFHGRPSLVEAEAMVHQGALWSSGVYAFRLEFMLHRLTELGLPVHYEELYKQFHRISDQSMEDKLAHQHTISKSVVVYDGICLRLGAWTSLSLRATL
ncbi:sugar phosphate nucleotidyltransferase [Paenibacillus sp. J5C_2022]|uniref:sugar phosphate nucleotidyltransferase n=1 Tax=Paenibacillus sp. J5C2022 TaxID=2977129 RepID=UPI0021D1E71E|nr:sugar phosphate nucleotidyltransferase [Paenibacillus sp. J5C2022]MCU6709188.1 sugar phosphate nucleotidyltransferase [Paenibacillus sp. J5C2022]